MHVYLVLSVNRELTVLCACQYTEFQKEGVKMNTVDKQRETCKFTSFFKREPQGKYEATLTFTIKGHKIYPKELCWIIDHFTVVCLIAWPLNESETGVDLVLIETSFLMLMMLFSC